MPRLKTEAFSFFCFINQGFYHTLPSSAPPFETTFGILQAAARLHVGLGHIVALYHCSSNLYHILLRDLVALFLIRQCDQTLGPAAGRGGGGGARAVDEPARGSFSIVYRICMSGFSGRAGCLTAENCGFRPGQMRLSEQRPGRRAVPGLGIKAGKGTISTSSQDTHTVVLYYNAILALHASLISSSRAAPGCSHASPHAAPHASITGRGSRHPRRHRRRSCRRCRRCAPPGAAAAPHRAPLRGARPPLARHIIEGRANSVIGHT